MDDFICCPICFEAYDDKLCAPLLLNACNYKETNERKESANIYNSKLDVLKRTRQGF